MSKSASRSQKGHEALQRRRDARRLTRLRRKYHDKEEKLATMLGITEAKNGHVTTITGTSIPRLSRNARRRHNRRLRAMESAKEVNFGKLDYSKCWYAFTFIGSCPVEALIDSGAEISIVSKRIYDDLDSHEKPALVPSKIKFRGIGGTQASLGWGIFPILLGNEIVKTKLHVVDLPHIDCILGMDAFEKEEVTFTMNRGILQIGGRRPIQLVRRVKGFTAYIRTTNPCTIRGKTARFVQATPPPGMDALESVNVGVVETMPHIYGQKGLIIPPNVVNKTKQIIPVYIVNPTDRDIELPAGTPIAQFSATDNIADVHATEFEGLYASWQKDQFESVDPANEECRAFKGDQGTPEIIPGCEGLPPALQGMFKGHALTPEQLQEAAKLVNDYQHVFVGPDNKLGRTDACEGHRIDTGDHPPIRQRLRRLPAKRKHMVEECIQELLEQKCIKPSDSDWASPVVIVQKKDGSPRFCLDYRKVNAITRKDAYPLPRIDDALDQLAGKQYFCTFDLASGYFQLPMAPEDAHKSAFITHMGLFEWLVLPQGMSNSPATFARCMDQVLKDLVGKHCLVYLDDIICFGKDFSETMDSLRLVFERLSKANLKMKPKKCHVFQKEVAYLGHIVSPEGIRTDSRKTDAVHNWDTPANVKDIRAFLGLASYYRKFIPNFATVAHPLTKLTEKNVKFSWSEDQQSAFDQLKRLLTSPPVLSYPSENGQYIVDTDASLFGIGAVLSQIQNGEEKVIAYASKTLSRQQRRYCTTKRELLAVVQFVSVNFRCYLAPEDNFIVRTDHSSLQWLMNFKEAEGMLGRWFQILSEFSFTIQHRSGIRHGNADALSRAVARKCPRDDCPQCRPTSKQVTEQIVSSMAASEAPILANANEANNCPGWTIDRLRQEQENDEDLARFKSLLREYGSEKPSAKVMAPESKDVKLYYSKWDEFTLQQEVLYRLPQAKYDHLRYVVPLRFRNQVLCYLHRNPLAGHFGIYRTTAAAVRRFYWPRMRADIKRYVKCCLRCEMAKPGPGKGKMPLIQEISGARNERVAFDIVGPLPQTKNGNRFVLTIGDYFTKYFVAVPLRRHTAADVADAIVREWVCKLGGCPLTLHSDRAPEFVGKVMTEMWKMLQIHPTHTLPYRPQSDGLVERFNATIKQMLRCTLGKHKNTWDDVLPYLVMAYNATEQASTGCTPNLLCFGEELVLPVDIMFGRMKDPRPRLNREGDRSYHSYVEEKRTTMVFAFSLARQILKKSAIRQERGYNVHLKKHAFDPGQWVLKWYKPAADRPLGRGWIGPYVVTRRISDVVYEIQAHPRLMPRTVHVDYLKPCFACEEHDNWVKNPDFKVPPGRPRTDPDEGEMDDLDEILSQEGQDDLDREALLRDLQDAGPENKGPLRDIRKGPSPPTHGKETRNGTAHRTAVRSEEAAKRSTSADAKTSLTKNGICGNQERSSSGSNQASKPSKKGNDLGEKPVSNDNRETKPSQDGPPKVTRYGRRIVPPRRSLWD